MISILIPVYNYNISLLLKQLNHEITSKNLNCEVCIIDDYSTDIAIEKENENLARLFNFLYSKNHYNLGRTLTRKLLADKATFDWILFLDADVLLKKESFIETYITKICHDTEVLIGGTEYKKENIDSNTTFRIKYGLQREVLKASERNKLIYTHIFSGNILLKKNIFLENNYNNESHVYGLDNYFAYNLHNNKVKILHINNPIFHMGLETNEIFFNKSISSLKNRVQLLEKLPNIEQTDKLISVYKKFKKYKLTFVISFLYIIFAPFLKKLVICKNPNLTAFDLYRLGYICNLKE